jgi:hypothetical protein
MATGDNWTQEDNKEQAVKARKVLEKVKKSREGKKFKYVPVPGMKKTFKEVEIKD